MFVNIEQLCQKFHGIESIIDRCIEEKWIRVVEKQAVRYLSPTDAYKLGFIWHLRKTGVAWGDIGGYLTPRYLYSVENPGAQ